MIHSFQTRIVLFFSVLFVGVQALTLYAVYAVTQANVIEQLGENLIYAEQIFDRLLTERGEIIASETRILAADFGFRAAVTDSNAATVRSAVENLTNRIHGRRGFYIDPNGVIVADSAGRDEGNPFYFQEAIAQAEKQGQAVAFGLLDGELYEFAVVPVLAPAPTGWIAIAVAVDRNLVQHFQQLTSTMPEITLIEHSVTGNRMLASSMPATLQTALNDRVALEASGIAATSSSPRLITLGESTFIARSKRLPTARADQPILAYLLLDLASAYQPYRIMLYAALGLLGMGLVTTLFGGVLIASRISRPIRLLSEGTQRIIAGHFEQPIPVVHRDEIGVFAEHFNLMTTKLKQTLDELEESNKTLEKKVEQRTAQYQQANKDLGLALQQLEQRNAMLQQEKEVVEDIVSRIRSSAPFDERHVRYFLSSVDRTAGDMLFSAYRSDGCQHVLVCDFSGHGLPAAIGGPLVSYMFYRLTAEDRMLNTILAEINRTLQRHLPTQLYMAACAVEIGADRRHAKFWNHGLPTVLTVSQGKIANRVKSAGLPLGIVDPIDIPADGEHMALHPQELIYIYSDGITEVPAPDGEAFGQERLEAWLVSIGQTHAELDQICTVLTQHHGNSDFPDDATLMEIAVSRPARLTPHQFESHPL